MKSHLCISLLDEKQPRPPGGSQRRVLHESHSLRIYSQVGRSWGVLRIYAESRSIEVAHMYGNMLYFPLQLLF